MVLNLQQWDVFYYVTLMQHLDIKIGKRGFFFSVNVLVFIVDTSS